MNHSYPMGPQVKAFIGAFDDDSRGLVPANEAEFKERFKEVLTSPKRPEDPEQIAAVIDELVAMDQPQLAVDCYQNYKCLPLETGFETVFAVGVAAMLVENLELASEKFKVAQRMNPDEQAPYVNLAQIAIKLDQDAVAKEWVLEGLASIPNSVELWTVFVELCHRATDYVEQIAMDVYSQAKSLASWMGCSIAWEHLQVADGEKVALFDQFFAEGERDEKFLIEYTGIAGRLGDFGKIQKVIWQLSSGALENLAWIVKSHLAQAYLALGKHEMAKSEFNEVLQIPKCPDENKKYISSWLKEIDAEMSENLSQ